LLILAFSVVKLSIKSLKAIRRCKCNNLRRGFSLARQFDPTLSQSDPKSTASHQLGTKTTWLELTKKQPTSDFKSTSDKLKTAKSKRKSSTFLDFIDFNVFMQLVIGSNITHPISLSWCRYAHRLTLYYTSCIGLYMAYT